MIPYSLIPATPHDKDTLYQIHRTAMIDIVTQVWGWDESVQIRMFDEYFGLSQLQMVRMGDVIVDYVDLVTEPVHDFVVNSILHPEVQGQGVGTAILRTVISGSLAKRVPLRLQVLRINTRARRLYEQPGFVVTGNTDTHLNMEFRG